MKANLDLMDRKKAKLHFKTFKKGKTREIKCILHETGSVQLSPVAETPSQSATSLAFEREFAQATIRTGCGNCAEIYLMRERQTSRVAPTGEFSKCRSSTIKRRMDCSTLRVFQRRDKKSHFSGVDNTMWDCSRICKRAKSQLSSKSTRCTYTAAT